MVLVGYDLVVVVLGCEASLGVGAVGFVDLLDFLKVVVVASEGLRVTGLALTSLVVRPVLVVLFLSLVLSKRLGVLSAGVLGLVFPVLIVL